MRGCVQLSKHTHTHTHINILGFVHMDHTERVTKVRGRGRGERVQGRDKSRGQKLK